MSHSANTTGNGRAVKISPLIDLRKAKHSSVSVHTLPDATAQTAGNGGRATELSPMHNFMDKLAQPDVPPLLCHRMCA